jgi:hypothetical protein
MRPSPLYLIVSIAICRVLSGCANIVPPEGGKKDVTGPKMLAIAPADSILNTRVKKIELRFNEYITVSDVGKEIQVSPLLPVPVSMISSGRKAVLELPDTALLNNTTYRISFGKSIKDLHEGNPMKPFTYTFSTGGYFDSLMLYGKVIDAATGLPDTGSSILLYDASKSDSAVVLEKPLYLGQVISGAFAVRGLPLREFRIYALKDGNNNLIFDGKTEKIGFIENTVFPADSARDTIVLKVFMEEQFDTAKKEIRPMATRKKKTESGNFIYKVNVDTAQIKKGTLDITKPATILFNTEIDSINIHKIFLSYDSLGIDLEAAVIAKLDSANKNIILINSTWKENTLYTLRLLKGFAKDSAGSEAMPSKYIFRTKSDDDYGKLHVHLPIKYLNRQFVLLIKKDKDTIYQKPVTDTMIHLYRLQPGGYNMFLVIDKDSNGKWTTGNLLDKLQPEEVIPFRETMILKAGWENTFDFEKQEKTKKPLPPNSTNIPQKGGR